LTSERTRKASLRALFGSASWYLSEKLVRLVGAFVVAAWMARYLGPLQYGNFAFVLSVVTVLGFLGSWGVESLVIRDIVQHPLRARQVVATYFLMRLTGALAVPVFAVLFLLFVHPGGHELVWMALVLSSVCLFSAFDVADCWLQASHQPRQTSLIRMTGFGVGAALKCGLIVGNGTLIWFACAHALEAACMAFAYRRVLRTNGIGISLDGWDQSEFQKLAIDGKWMILSGLTVVLYSKMDILVVGTVLSKEVLGHYAVAASVYGAWNLLGMSLAQAYAPHVAAARASNARDYIGVLRRFLLLMVGVSVSGSLVLGLLSESLFTALFGPAYLGSAHIFAILIWSSMPVFLGIATSQIIVNEQLYAVSMLRTSLGLASSLALMMPVASRYGAEGVAVVVVISSVVATSALLFSRAARKILFAVFSPRAVI